MGCGSSAPVSDDHPISIKKDLNLSTIFEARESMERQDSIAAKKLAQEIQESLDKEKEKKDAEGYASKLEGAAEIAAAGAVAGAMATAAATAVVNSDANLQNAPEELVKVTGEALLEMAKTVPFVAPVAYLIGAIASSAVTAVTLKADCVEFGKIVQMLEKILLKAENLESHEEVVEDVKGSLEEGLQLMQKMQDRGIIAATFLAKSDKSKFEDLKVRIEEAINRLNLSVTVDTAAITKAKFQQSEELRKKVEELGGPEALETNPEAAKELEQHMEASDQILSANINAARKSLKAVGEEVVKSNKVLEAITEQQQIHMKETRKSILKTDSQLQEMSSNFIQLQQQSELQRLQNDFLKRQVDELKSMLSEVKDAFVKFPVPAREPERQLVINNGGFTQITSEDRVLQKIKDICMEAVRKWNTICQANIIGDLTQFTTCGYMPPYQMEPVGPKSEPVECAIDLCGIQVPRKMGFCQHVVARENPVLFVNEAPKAEKASTMAPYEVLQYPSGDFGSLSKSDPKVKEFLDKVSNDKPLLNIEDSSKRMIVESYLGKILEGGEFFYSGVPIRVQGQVMGSFCLHGIEHPKNFGEADVAIQKQMCARVEMALEQHLESKQMQAQQAMMMGLQMMQMQQGGGGMMNNMMSMMNNMNNMMMQQQQHQY